MIPVFTELTVQFSGKGSEEINKIMISTWKENRESGMAKDSRGLNLF